MSHLDIPSPTKGPSAPKPAERPHADIGPAIERGAVTSYRIYDVADELHLPVAEQVLARGARHKLSPPAAESIHIAETPLTVDLGPRVLALPGGAVPISVSARLYDFGAISIRLRRELEKGTPWAALGNASQQMQTAPAVDAACKEALDLLLPQLKSAMVRPHPWDVAEDYTIVQLEKLAGDPSARKLSRRRDLPHVLLGEDPARSLSSAERNDVLKHCFSYYTSDLAAVDWNSALIYDPAGSTDIADVLELATAQLLELRYYDALLDREMKRVYDEIGDARRGPRLLGANYGALARRVMTTVLEVGEFTERAENSLKVVGDFFLARIYTDAVKQFRIPQWQAAVYRKLESLGQVYALLKGEVDTGRSQLLELTIVLLIVWEIVMAVTRAL